LIQGVDPLLIAEGKRDADNLRALGFVVSCNHGGAGKWHKDLSPWFKGRRVFVFVDNDPAGENHQSVVGAALNGIASEIRVVRFNDLGAGEDVSDLIDRCGDQAKDELIRRLKNAPEWDNPKPSPVPAAVKSPTETAALWPEMDAAAYYGLTGIVVETIAPHSEADPVAILIQFLTAAGNVLGRRCFYQIEGDRHSPNLFSVLVGASAKARKGTSWGRVRSIIEIAEAAWALDKVKGGLSSGEGFIYEVRDKVEKWCPKDEVLQVLDPGVDDKRLLVMEPEFAGALAVMERHGNTLSPLIRKAWDGDKLRAMTKNSPLSATGAHVSIIGHITEEELRARLTRTDAANGSPIAS
jgi:hypothetical protein